MLHNDNYIKKFKTNEIMVTFGNTADGRILLNKLNEMVAKEKGVSVEDMAKDPEAPVKAPAKKTTKKADAKETTAKKKNLGTTDARFRQGMAGGSRGTTLYEHAGQVPTLHRHPFKK